MNGKENREAKRLKKIKSYQCSLRDQRHNCSFGMIAKFNGKHYMVGITTPLFIYMVSKRGITKKMSWQTWEGVEVLANKGPFWNERVVKCIKLLKKKIKSETKARKAKKIDRKPKIKRTPIRRPT